MAKELADMEKDQLVKIIVRTRKILIDGLRYYEHDGHDMPKAVARVALTELRVPAKDQP